MDKLIKQEQLEAKAKRLRPYAKKLYAKYDGLIDEIVLEDEFDDNEVLIKCVKHGFYYRRNIKSLLKPDSDGDYCTKCRIETDRELFLRQAKKLYGDAYLFDKTEIHHRRRKVVTFTCKEHGDFKRSLKAFLNGTGCPLCCGVYAGWTRQNFKTQCEKVNGGKADLYIIKCFNDTEYFYKIGITSVGVTKRFKDDSDMPYDYSVIHIISDDAGKIWDYERHLHKLLESKSYKPMLFFVGHTECFSSIDGITEIIGSLALNVII